MIYDEDDYDDTNEERIVEDVNLLMVVACSLFSEDTQTGYPSFRILLGHSNWNFKKALKNYCTLMRFLHVQYEAINFAFTSSTLHDNEMIIADGGDTFLTALFHANGMLLKITVVKEILFDV